MNRRTFLAGSLALLTPAPLYAPHRTDVRYVLCGDSLAYVLGPAFRAEAKKRDVPVAVWAKGGSSARQWLVKKWFRRVAKEYPAASVYLISLGVNCTRVERPKLAEDISKIVNLVNDLRYQGEDETSMAPAVAWLLPPPLAMDTQYVHDAVAASEVFAFSPGALPLESDGIHPTFRGAQEWASTIARVLWE